MGKTPLALALLVLVVGASFFYYRHKQAKPRTWATTDEFIQWLASEAVKDAQTQSRVQLDYSVGSLKAVDKILGGVHDAYVKNPSSVSVTGLGSAYGAYVGEVIRKTEPNVRWERDDAIGEKTYPLIWDGGHSYPLGWCQKRIINGDEDSVWVKYSVLKKKSPVWLYKERLQQKSDSRAANGSNPTPQ